MVFAVFEDFQALDLFGPLECFAGASQLRRARNAAPPYEVCVASTAPGPCRTSSGVLVHATTDLRRIRRLDTLVVVGGDGTRAAASDPALLEALRRLAPRARRVCSVCTGAFVLAAAGLLSGRRATTHWRWAETLARKFLDVRVEPDRIWVHDGPVFTSAGVTAGIDLALALVESDEGSSLALELARQLVVYLRRPGGQAQFSDVLEAQHAPSHGLRALVCFIEAHPAADLGVDVLAARANMSPRHFARTFASQVGLTPAKFVARVRVEAARRQLESAASVDETAAACGFGTPESLRRAFHRALGTSPSEYRARFTPPRSPS